MLFFNNLMNIFIKFEALITGDIKFYLSTRNIRKKVISQFFFSLITTNKLLLVSKYTF